MSSLRDLDNEKRWDIIYRVFEDNGFNSGDYHEYDNSDDTYFAIMQSWSGIKTFNNLFFKLYPEYSSEYENIKDTDNTSILDDLTHDNWGFSDEYDVCYHCNKVVHTQDYYRVNYIINDCELVCNDCLHEELDTQKSYCEYLENNPKAANYNLTDDELESLSYIKIDKSYENGWYGIIDDPKEILDKLLEEKPDGKFIFNVTNFHQFATYFEVWRKK